MTPIQNLALDLLMSTNGLDDEEFDIAARTIENTLTLLFKNGYTVENLTGPLNAEYDRMIKQDNDEIAKEFFG